MIKKDANPLWSKANTERHPAVHGYIIQKNMADHDFIPHDIQGSIAHATMLGAAGIIPANESGQLVKALKRLLALQQAGEWTIDASYEDVHSAVERWLTEQLGDVGKKLHTGRSRNDQVLTDMRLWTMETLETISASVHELGLSFLHYAEQHAALPMTGYTHTQPAMPSSVGQWAASFAEALSDDLSGLRHAMQLNSQCPLGSAAGFGTSFPIDRVLSAKLLGFDRVQINPMYCQLSRGKIEAATIGALAQVMLTLNRFANDCVWFLNPSFGFFTLDSTFTTGSSIMPQKRNPDIYEVLRGKTGVVLSLQQQCQMLGLNLPSGYNKDTKFSKKCLMDTCKIVRDSVEIVALSLPQLRPNKEALLKAMTPELYATDWANELVAGGMPFREAYQKVGQSLDEIVMPDPVANLREKIHLGATGNLGLDEIRAKFLPQTP